MRRHELDLVSLIGGLVFVVVGAAALILPEIDLNLDLPHVDPRWVVAVVLVGLGTAGLATSAAALARRRGADRDY